MQPHALEIIKVRNLERTKRFYKSLGFVLVEEQHDGGPIHYSVDFGGCLWEFFPAKNTATATKSSKDRLLIVDVKNFDDLLALCEEMELAYEAVTYYDQNRGLRTTTVDDPDGWRIKLMEVSSEPVH